jgi:hypothetical protein
LVLKSALNPVISRVSAITIFNFDLVMFGNLYNLKGDFMQKKLQKTDIEYQIIQNLYTFCQEFYRIDNQEQCDEVIKRADELVNQFTDELQHKLARDLIMGWIRYIDQEFTGREKDNGV